MAARRKAATGGQATVRAGAAPKYAVEKLQENCRQLFGVSTSTFAGATYGMTGKYTVEEMRAHIEAWQKREVK
mgnify:FL=1|jgi:hypothetical protein|nr:MAG TPA: hypothetical protein [Caudoviricetes sp.]